MKGKSNQESLPSHIQGLARVDAWLALVRVEGRAASEATVNWLLTGPQGHCDGFAVFPENTPATPDEGRLRALYDLWERPTKHGLGYCEIEEIYSAPLPNGTRLLNCKIVKECPAQETLAVMDELGFDTVLFAEGAGLALLHHDGQREPLSSSVDDGAVLTGWKEWSRRRYPDGPLLHLLSYPPGGWGSNYSMRRDEDRRLDARYGREAKERAISRIMAGVEPGGAVAEMAAGK